MDDLFSICFQERLCISFSLCSTLDIWIFTYVFSYCFWRSSRRILPILVFSLTFLHVFLDSLNVFYFLFFSVALSLSFQPISAQNPLSTNLNYNNFLPLTKLWLCRYFYFASWWEMQNTDNYRSTSTSPVWFPAQNAGRKLCAYAASHLLVHINSSCNS